MSTHQSNGVNVTFAPRAVVNQPVVGDQGKRSVVERYIQEAIQNGDNMGIPSRPVPQGGVQRRALIIAPECEDYPEGELPTLPATATDVKLVHDMLIKSGYEGKNIRILCDVCAGNGYSYPTRKNVLDSLEWLTSDITPNAYRYLHFSGHGVHILSDDKKDMERSKSNIRSNSRIFEQTVPKNELRYYNEAIATRKDVSDKDYPRDMILDSTLNQYLSKLPQDCTITCTLDCCASGRMINLPVKVVGSGFRGRVNLPTKQTLGPPETKPAGTDEALNHHSQEDTTPSPNGEASVLGAAIEAFSRFVFQPLSVDPLLVTLHENLPQREKAMNSVKARILSWSASHQRQEAWNHNDGHAGLFTQSFTQAYREQKMSGSGTFTYKQLYHKARQVVLGDRMNPII
ncbi:unnamed protein product [Rhizoctonia solani]|uniref:Peptidase C14 caspase domain-containing protein n=1 Tax=Rhizoctonia solani TaxID=456999 RepID=A0A8H3ASR6_9AGAM|nr:unnamed protein product [Rhizoctonia solani]